MVHSPPWERDELILVLDLYFRVGARVDMRHPEIIALSGILRRLPIHPPAIRNENFRSAGAVHLKLQNFLAIDPEYHGKGLTHGGRAERDVWKKFSGNKVLLAKLAKIITETANNPPEPALRDEIAEEETFPEGRMLYRLHKMRERNVRLVRKLKDRWLSKHGTLSCQVCGFDFQKTYGELKRGYIECHHNIPLSELSAESRTRLGDLALVCPNCHRMLHRKRPWISVASLSEIVSRQRGGG